MMATIQSTGPTGVQLLLIIILVTVPLAAIGAKFAAKEESAKRKRSRDLQMLATRLGFEGFNPTGDEEFLRGWRCLTRLRRGEKVYGSNFLRGMYHAQRMFVFNCRIQINPGDEGHQLLIFMHSGKQDFPRLFISPGNRFLQLAMTVEATLFDGERIQFESAEFSRAFCVWSRDKRFAYDVCNAKMMEFLLANRDLDIEMEGPVILLAFAPQLPVVQIEFNLQRLVEFRSLLPEYLFANK